MISKSLSVLMFCLLVLSGVLISNKVGAATDTRGVTYDKSVIQARLPDKQSLEDYKKDKHFDYEEEARGKSWLSRFFDWLGRKLSFNTHSSKDYSYLGKFIWYTILAVAIILILYFIFKDEIRGLIWGGPGRKHHIKVEEVLENIHEIDFDTRINEAISAKNYRYAIRLFYLKSLKGLTDAQLIDWKPDKTNRDYLYELAQSSHARPFEEVTYLFNLVWYGDFPVDEAFFDRASLEFRNFNQQLPQGKA